MADKVSTSRQLKLLMGFSDGDDRTLALDNPRANLTAAEIKAINSLMAGVIIGDKYGASFAELKDANIETTRTTVFDLDV